MGATPPRRRRRGGARRPRTSFAAPTIAYDRERRTRSRQMKAQFTVTEVTSATASAMRMRSAEPPLHRLRQLARGDRRPDEPAGLASTEGPRTCTIGPMIAGPLSCTMTGALRWHARPLCPGRPGIMVPRPDHSKGRHLREGFPPHALDALAGVSGVSRRHAPRNCKPSTSLARDQGASLCTPVAPQERTTDGTDRGPRPAASRAPRPTARPPVCVRGADQRLERPRRIPTSRARSCPRYRVHGPRRRRLRRRRVRPAARPAVGGFA
jgi:hypothetical protein